MLYIEGIVKQTPQLPVNHDYEAATQAPNRRGGCFSVEAWPWCVHINYLCRCKAQLCLIEFNNAGCLLISEVKYLLENRDKDAPDTAYVIQG